MAFVKFRGNHQYYEIMKALHGLKTAPRDYQDEVAKGLRSLSFIRLIMCSCLRFRQLCETTKPIWDARRVVGIKLECDRSRHIIKIRMSEKVAEVCDKFSINTDARKYVIKDDQFDL